MGNVEAFLIGETSSTDSKAWHRFSSYGSLLSLDNSPEFLTCYQNDSQTIERMMPLGVIRPHTYADISEIIKICFENNIPFSIRCGGTGLSGASLAAQGGLIILTGHLKKILDYNPSQGIITVEPGATAEEINSRVISDGWHLPCLMDSAGVAGVAGSVCMRARPYRQGKGPFLDQLMLKISIVDGKGGVVNPPPLLIAGSEGMLGAITSITFRLLKKPALGYAVAREVSLEASIDLLPALRRCGAVSSVEWNSHPTGIATVRIEGDSVEADAALQHVEKFFLDHTKAIEPKRSLLSNIPRGHRVFILSSSVPTVKMKEAIDHAMLFEGCFAMAQLLDSRLTLLLHSNEEEASFTKKVESFLVSWANKLDQWKGSFISSHGIGAVFSKYLPPFLCEGDFAFLQNLKAQFDPKNLIGRGHFFPKEGRCLVLRQA